MNPLARFRVSIGATQADIALLTDLSRQSVSAIEEGLWESFPKETHLTLKRIAQDEFGYPWPESYEILNQRYQSSRIERRIDTSQKTVIAKYARSTPDFHRLKNLALAHNRHPFSVWRERAVGTTSLRGFCKLVAVNPEIVREYEHQGRYYPLPQSLREALLDCGVKADLLDEAVAMYWSDQ
jgi:transcriptional regulator with XRE-family HTH domain